MRFKSISKNSLLRKFLPFAGAIFNAKVTHTASSISVGPSKLN